MLPTLCPVSFAESCEPPINSLTIRSLERETDLVFQAKTSSKVTVVLRQILRVVVYQLEFGNANDRSNIVTIKGTGVSNTNTFDYTSANTNLFWVSWKNNVVAIGAGGFPGENEIIRLTDEKMGNGKPISSAGISTGGSDVGFKIFRGTCIQ